jgi:hypothetical protein
LQHNFIQISIINNVLIQRAGRNMNTHNMIWEGRSRKKLFKLPPNEIWLFLPSLFGQRVKKSPKCTWKGGSPWCRNDS